MSVDRGIGHATTSYSANYPQTSYATPHATNFLAPYATVDVHNSAPHLHGHGRISETSTGAQMPSPTTVAYHVPPTQLHNFGDISLSKGSKSVGGKFYPDWIIKKNLTCFWDECNVVLHELIKEGKPINSTAIQARLCQKEKAFGVDRIIKKDGDSDNKVNLAIEKTESNIRMPNLF